MHICILFHTERRWKFITLHNVYYTRVLKKVEIRVKNIYSRKVYNVGNQRGQRIVIII